MDKIIGIVDERKVTDTSVFVAVPVAVAKLSGTSFWELSVQDGDFIYKSVSGWLAKDLSQQTMVSLDLDADILSKQHVRIFGKTGLEKLERAGMAVPERMSSIRMFDWRSERLEEFYMSTMSFSLTDYKDYLEMPHMHDIVFDGAGRV